MRSPTRPTASSAPAGWSPNEPALRGMIQAAWCYPRRMALFVSVAILGGAADLLTKHWVFQWRGMPRENNEWWIWEGVFGIETALNDGAVFGLGSGWGPAFAALSVVAALGIVVWLFYGGAAADFWLTLALACVTAGIIGNLYDRLGLWQDLDAAGVWRTEVRDWILLRYKNYTWPNFNIADSLLVCGAGLLLWHGFSRPEPVKTTAKGESVNN